LKRIRSGAQGANRFLPIIVAQAQPSAQAVRQAIDNGAHEIMVLPASLKSVSNLIYRAVFISRPFIEVANYVGPCRRRRASRDYRGPDRRRAPWPGYVHASHKAQERMV
jgi:hypothetical protein